jgi:hypothetical protein
MHRRPEKIAAGFLSYHSRLRVVSLTPGFSQVLVAARGTSRFNGLIGWRQEKAVETAGSIGSDNTELKHGVNEKSRR